MREPRGVRVRADLRRPVGARAGRHEAPGQQPVPGLLDDRVRLAGEEGLVDLERGGLDHPAVDDDLVAGAELDHVVDDDVRLVDLRPRPVAAHAHGCPPHDRQRVQRALGTQLLDDPDAGVREDRESEEAVDQRARAQRQDEEDPSTALIRVMVFARTMSHVVVRPNGAAAG